jgi:hypothetical protein
LTWLLVLVKRSSNGVWLAVTRNSQVVCPPALTVRGEQEIEETTLRGWADVATPGLLAEPGLCTLTSAVAGAVTVCDAGAAEYVLMAVVISF